MSCRLNFTTFFLIIQTYKNKYLDTYEIGHLNIIFSFNKMIIILSNIPNTYGRLILSLQYGQTTDCFKNTTTEININMYSF